MTPKKVKNLTGDTKWHSKFQPNMISSLGAILVWKSDDDVAAAADTDDDRKSDPYMSPSYAGDTKSMLGWSQMKQMYTTKVRDKVNLQASVCPKASKVCLRNWPFVEGYMCWEYMCYDPIVKLSISWNGHQNWPFCEMDDPPVYYVKWSNWLSISWNGQ